MVFARYPVLFVVVIIRFAIQAFNFDANFITYRYGTGQISVCFVGIFAHRWAQDDESHDKNSDRGGRPGALDR